jgi:predicted alpha/beta-fold hydrolase
VSRFIENIKAEKGVDEILLTGHSLGGSMFVG